MDHDTPCMALKSTRPLLLESQVAPFLLYYYTHTQVPPGIELFYSAKQNVHNVIFIISAACYNYCNHCHIVTRLEVKYLFQLSPERSMSLILPPAALASLENLSKGTLDTQLEFEMSQICDFKY